MRYLFPKGQKNELRSRKKYIYNSLHLWTIPSNNNDDFFYLEGFPKQYLDILFITGHNYKVKDYLIHNINNISESIIVAITCNHNFDISFLTNKGKTIYFPHQHKNSFVELINGTLYGFDFNLTKSEILFYNNNTKSNIVKRLDASFTKYN